ncbi:phage tail protein domain [Synechococcus sp. PCC 7335]|uniref:phage tail protein n=1 Tax=Synechococcus sp. (strain ATCC 29403 / PCC 7335) TaxID=91464 RepID=UPI00017ED664|nr:phage tail protein [Synechococcus sp. PCC 7335]EDX83220.1 phage tail protein domain [Synechococcus sp. PCC 7335]
MAQLRAGQMVAIELVPLQEPAPASGSAITFSPSDRLSPITAIQPPALSTRLSLHPGEASELVVRIKNQGDHPLQLQFAVSGEMPRDWWRLRTEGSTLPTRHQMEVVLYFAISSNFFERPLSPEQLPLQLDYKGQLKIIATAPRGDSETHINPFNLLVRPPSLYLDFLPDIYRRIDIVGRFLKIFETTFEPTVDILDHLWAYLDPLIAPQAMLPFLAHWVGWSFEGPLSLEQQRTLIRYAMEIYRWRGTRRGLRFYLHLASGLPLDDHLPVEAQKSIGIHENFSPGHVLGQTVLGASTLLGGTRPCHFSVQLRPPANYPLDEALIRTIIDQETSAFCSYDLFIETPPGTSPDTGSDTS